MTAQTIWFELTWQENGKFYLDHREEMENTLADMTLVYFFFFFVIPGKGINQGVWAFNGLWFLFSSTHIFLAQLFCFLSK